MLLADHGGGAQDAQRAEGEAGGELGRPPDRRRQRPLRGGRAQAAQGREIAQAREEGQNQGEVTFPLVSA